MFIKDEFFKIKDKVYPCVSLYDCLLGAGEYTYIFNDKIKESHYLHIHKESLSKIFLCYGSIMSWETKDGTLIVKGKMVEPAYMNLSLIDIGDDIIAKEYLDKFNFEFNFEWLI